MNPKKTLLQLGFVAMLIVALPLRAQTGCDDSPEDPTIVLTGRGTYRAANAFSYRGTRRFSISRIACSMPCRRLPPSGQRTYHQSFPRWTFLRMR
jgi:XrtJ-associated TM-motif-TM protein